MQSDRAIIIAEAGVNHNGDINLAKKLIDVAAEAGADYIKFQTFKASKLVSRQAQQADYQAKNLNTEKTSQLEMLQKLELSEHHHLDLIEHAHQKGVKFLSTGFDEESVDFLDSLKIDLFKIPSGELTNYPYLKHIASKRRPIVLSTGMATLGEVEAAIDVLTNNGANISDITILHCNTDYPTKFSDVNLKAMLTLGNAFKTKFGYSDHTLGIEIPIAAVALGATVIEKHFTLSRQLEGPDHAASLEPGELQAMIQCIRNVEDALGNGVKEPTVSELANKVAARKSVHIKSDLAAGHILTENDLIMKRPGDGISPMEYPKLIGRVLGTACSADYKLSYSDLI